MPEPITSFTGPNRWASNFWPAEVMYENVTYPSVEYAYQAAKTLDLKRREVIRLAPTPGIAKRLGRKVKVRKDWERVKVSIMLGLLRQKFAPDTLEYGFLMTSRDAELIEGNHWGDTFWGVCNGTGQNILGKLLMLIRSGWTHPDEYLPTHETPCMVIYRGVICFIERPVWPWPGVTAWRYLPEYPPQIQLIPEEKSPLDGFMLEHK